ncbi:glycoside hydrolase [Mycena alexandri]|uniref:Glycoside hydrolase n=1 Tax=Mycena alexandri TaxID=1745969 RepID=A0AAD6XFG5_9AGAR|nr:glycoside hydrolase [Mycena alexandri]
MKLHLLGLTLLAGLVQAIPSSTNSTIQKRATPKLVVAHFIVGIVDGYTQADWANDIALAAATGIDAFALNIGTDSWTDTQLALAYAAARSTSFKLFISFDFAASPGFGTDPNNQIIPRLNLYASDAAQLQWGNGALVSTFSGDGFDWSGVRSAVGHPLEIIPFYQAAQAHQDSTDGLFMWNAWPSQDNQPIDQTMSIAGDQFYQSQLAGSPYMAGVSPWFFTHYNQQTFNKNWLYLSDTLLIDRWNQILNLQPQLVELITWNDFGESHYIGPLHPERPSVYAPSGDADGAIQWAAGFPHDAWRKIVTPYIAAYKNGGPVTISPSQENIVYWYRPHPKGLSCADPFLGPPTGQSFPADGIWAATLLASPATLTMTSGTFSLTTTAPAGINYFSTGMGSGQPTFKLVRNGVTITQGTGGLSIDLNSCNIYNFNAFVGSTR